MIIVLFAVLAFIALCAFILVGVFFPTEQEFFDSEDRSHW